MVDYDDILENAVAIAGTKKVRKIGKKKQMFGGVNCPRCGELVEVEYDTDIGEKGHYYGKCHNCGHRFNMGTGRRKTLEEIQKEDIAKLKSPEFRDAKEAELRAKLAEMGYLGDFEKRATRMLEERKKKSCGCGTRRKKHTGRRITKGERRLEELRIQAERDGYNPMYHKRGRGGSFR